MTPRARLAWVLFLIFVAVFFGYVLTHRQPEPLESFQQILNLTPDELQDRCGLPRQDNNGVVVANDGIRDLHYRDADGKEIVFRFISGDGEAWDSLGAWDKVNAPDELGRPVESAEAVQRISCAVKMGASVARLFPKALNGRRPSVPSGLAVALLLAPAGWQDTVPHSPSGSGMEPGRGMGPHPGTGTGPSPNLGGATLSGTLAGAGGMTPTPQPRSGGGGPGSGAEPGSPVPVIALCPPGIEGCEILEYVEFTEEITQAIQAEREDDFDRALHWLTGDKVKVIKLPVVAYDRQEAIKQIFRLEVRSINITVARLRDDVSRLEPFQNDSAQVQQQKLDLVRQDDQQRRQIWKNGVDESRNSTVNSASRSSSSPSSGIPFESHAYRQAVQIHLSGNWQN